jgi:hypothetical protein
MSALKKVAFYLALMVLAQSGHAAVIFSNLTDAFAGVVNVSATQWLAAQATVGANAITVDNIGINIYATDGSAALVARVCADNAGAPDLASCSTFTTADAITGARANISFTGSYAAAANATVWIVLNSSAAGVYRWSQSNAAVRPWAASGNAGSTWTPQGAELLHSISGTALPASVPTLSEWSLISFAMLVLGVGVYQQRRRQL